MFNRMPDLPSPRTLLIVLAAAWLTPITSAGQNLASADEAPCTCSTQLDWVHATLRVNDAGYDAAIEGIDAARHAAHLDSLRATAASQPLGADCTDLLERYVRFFRTGHLYVNPVGGGPADAPAEQTDVPDLPARTVDTAALIRTAAQADDPLLGVWHLGAYTVAIERAPDDPARYAGRIVASDNEDWAPGQVKFTFDPEAGTGTYLMGDHSPRALHAVDAPVAGALTLAPYGTWRRLSPKPVFPPGYLAYETDYHSDLPLLRELSTETVYLRVPSFATEYQPYLDSLLAAHHDALMSHDGLIVDVRGNTGGSDWTFARLLDYLYTHPIRQPAVEFLSTPLNDARYEWILEMPGLDSAARAWVADIQSRLAGQPAGTWVMETDSVLELETRERVLPRPARVIVLTDGDCASSCEGFVLAARQSAKVKTMGLRTFGALDVSNMNFVESPCGAYRLSYATSRSRRLPDYPVDDYGIQPDVLLEPELVAPWEWVGYAKRRLE